MACVADAWKQRNPTWFYRTCYDELGRTCCRADVITPAPGVWELRTQHKHLASVSRGVFSRQQEAGGAALKWLQGCGCTGLNGGGFGRAPRCGRGRR